MNVVNILGPCVALQRYMNIMWNFTKESTPKPTY